MHGRERRAGANSQNHLFALPCSRREPRRGIVGKRETWPPLGRPGLTNLGFSCACQAWVLFSCSSPSRNRQEQTRTEERRSCPRRCARVVRVVRSQYRYKPVPRRYGWPVYRRRTYIHHCTHCRTDDIRVDASMYIMYGGPFDQAKARCLLNLCKFQFAADN